MKCRFLATAKPMVSGTMNIAALVQQIVNKEFNFAPFFLSTALSFFAVAKAMPVKLALYKEKNEAKYTTHYLQIAALVLL